MTTRSARSGAPAATVKLVPSARTVKTPSLSRSSHVVGRATRRELWNASIAATSQRDRVTTSPGNCPMLFVPHRPSASRIGSSSRPYPVSS